MELEKLKAEMEIKQADAGERNGRLMERDAVDRLNGARILAMRSPLLRLDTNATTWAGMEEFELRQALHQWSANVFRQVIDDDHANQAYEHMRRLESLAEAARALIDSRHDQGEITQDAWDGLEEAVAEVGPNSNWDT
ncbi:hypothetical protein CMI47_04235 [Candidatus Pacearchaeota archaeon]|nr:hypothetical protein [Candidatus Pacearchaeota archaeon]